MPPAQTFEESAASNRPHRVTLQRGLREVMKRFGEFDNAVMQDGALDFKTKELIAIAVSVALRCDDCIGFHVQAALKAGAGEQEVMEALGVAILLGGGPGVMYSTHAVQAMQEQITKGCG